MSNHDALIRLKRDKTALLRALDNAGAKRNGDLAHIRCPFHAGGLEEHTGSLSVFEDNSGEGWRWRCHVCDTGGDLVDVIAKAEGLDNGAALKRTLEIIGHYSGPAWTTKRLPATSPKPAAVFQTIEDAGTALSRQTGSSCTRQDVYLGADGRAVMAVLRLDVPGKGKTFRPLHLTPDGWAVGDPTGPLPLFHLDRLTACPDELVIIAEGEKCAETLEQAGFIATTSAHGAKSAAKTDWTPLAGRTVTIWPDHDGPGADYRDDVTSILQNLNPPATVLWVDTLRYDPPEGWDAADYVREMQRMPLGDEQIRAELQAVIATASVAPRKWLCGVDLDDCCAAARLADASTFQPKRFIPTGYSQLDKALGGGWYEGEATTLFAPSSMGKSSVMLNLAVAAARQGIPTAVLSLEMRGSDVLQLATSIVADLPRLHVRCGTMTANENEKMQAAIAELSQWPLYVVDRSRFPVDPQHPEAPTMQAVADVMREGVTRCGWRLVILDYLTKVGPFGDDDLTRYPKLTNWAFDLAQRLGIHFICLAQTGKSSWGRKDENGGRSISLEDCKGSIEVIADFDNAIGLVRDDWNSEAPEDSPLLRAVVLKARQAAGGVCQLVFHRLTGRVEEVTPEQQAAPDLRAHVGSHRQSPEESAALLEKCIPAIPAPRAVILLSAEEHGIPASRATALLSRAIHERRAFKARVNGEYLYANNSEAFEQILTAEAATEKEEA